ncbi:MAG TPA: response regulator [Microvirga sp.]|jgi:CheY-like chemotaxis protein|nr:response regulator [Microvirga sp.]
MATRTSASGSSARPVVILTEEDTRQRKDIAAYLEGEGFSVVEAGDSDEALSRLKDRPEALGFVTDAHVPGSIDGFELARRVRERHPALAVVLVSGHSDASSGPVPEGGAFVAKPYLLEHLAPTLRRLIGG